MAPGLRGSTHCFHFGYPLSPKPLTPFIVPMLVYAWLQESYGKSVNLRVSSNVRGIVLDKVRVRVSKCKCFSTHAQLDSLCTEDETGNATSCMHCPSWSSGATSKEWLSRYEATNYSMLYVYVADLYPTRSDSVQILEVGNLEINGGTGPRAVLYLAVSPGMDAVMRVLSNHQSVICTSCGFLASTVQFGPAGESHVEAALMGAVFRCEPRAQLPLARKLQSLHERTL